MAPTPPTPTESGDTAEKTDDSVDQTKELAELRAQMALMAAQLSKLAPSDADTTEEETEEDAEESAPKPEEKKKVAPKPDAMAIDFAETLKQQLGKNYDKELDKLPLNVRIPTMKALLKQVGIAANREGKTPKGAPVAKAPIMVPNRVNYVEMAKKIKGEK